MYSSSENGHIKVILFDIGNVLVDFDLQRAADKMAEPCRKTAQEVLDFFYSCELTGIFEEGKISPRDFFTAVTQQLGRGMQYSTFLEAWNSIFFLSDNNKQVHKFTQYLSRRYTVALLSNVNILHLDFLKIHYPFLASFRHIFASYELHLRKPSADIYHRVMHLLSVKPEEVFYTDDRPDFVLAAQQIGVHACTYTHPQQLESDLLRHGVVAAGELGA